VRHLDVLKWGLVPYFTKDLKKARRPISVCLETIARSGISAQRTPSGALCRLPFITNGAAIPDGNAAFAIGRIDGDPVAFGGVWEEWSTPDRETLRTFATTTTDANSQLAAIQDRMPVIIESEDWPLWLGESDGDPGTLLCPHLRTSCQTGTRSDTMAGPVLFSHKLGGHR
jgi:putative SOS response-associated peptidase YedK